MRPHKKIGRGLDALPDDHAYGANPNEVRVHVFHCGAMRCPHERLGHEPDALIDVHASNTNANAVRVQRRPETK